MKRLYKYLLSLLLISIMLSGCQTVKDGIQGKKKSTSADEFLVKKKDPLVLPPDFEELPLPRNIKKTLKKQDEIDLKSIINKNSNSENKLDNLQNKKSTTLEKAIIEKINKN